MNAKFEKRACVICGDEFTPSHAEQKACGYVCGGALRKQRYRGKQRSANPTQIGQHEHCRCTTCRARQGETREDRAALIAKVAAEKGVPVATGEPPPKLNPAQLARRNAIIRRRIEATSL